MSLRRPGAAVAAVLALISFPSVAAAVLLWTISVTPLSATVGARTAFTFTVVNLDALTKLGCVHLDAPASFIVHGASAGVASNGVPWAAQVSGNTILVSATRGNGPLGLSESVSFVVEATATAAGIWLWPNHAHADKSCGGAEEPGSALSTTVAEALTESPTPTPTPTPTPSPTPTPTPTPTPSPTLTPTSTPTPTPKPGGGPPASKDPSRQTNTSNRDGARATAPGQSKRADNDDDAAEASASASRTNSPSLGGATDAAAASASPAPARDRTPRVVLDPEAADVDLIGMATVDGVDMWLVPAASLGVPGVVVMAWVALQTVGGLMWLPVVRRILGDDRGRRRNRRRRVPRPAY